MRSYARMALLVALVALDSYARISLRVLSKHEVQSEFPPFDIRWAGPGEVYLSLGKGGVIRRGTEALSQNTAVIPPANRGGFPISSRLAAGDTHIVTGSPFGGFGWMDIGTTAVAKKGQRSILTLMDLDARGDTVAVLGADSGEVQGLASDGVIAWVGSLSENLQDMKPLMKGRSRPGGKDMARCGFLESGAIRFMRDGSLVVVPGVEPGAYRYDASGKLLQTWDTKPFGIIDDCDVQPTQLALLGRDFGSRIAWLSSRVRVDDILALADGAALLLRYVEGGVTKWELVTLPFRGKSQRMDLPVSVPTPRGHARGDVRGNEMALLIYDAPLPGEKPAVKPRVYVIAIQGQ